MSSDEDFSLVAEAQPPSTDTLEGVEALISNYKKKYEQLIQEQKDLVVCRDDRRKLAEQFRERTAKLKQSLREDESSNKKKLENEKARLNLLLQGQTELMEEIQKVEAALKEEEAQNSFLKQQMEVFTAVPRRSVVFNGSTAKVGDAQMFVMEPRITYPMEGGTVLVTFEEEVVATKILDMKHHRVDLGAECRITVEARPIQLMMPRLVEIDSEVCPRRILISNLPKMEIQTLLDRLEIHFSKSRNGGGEVEVCEMLADSWNVVLTFVEKDVAKGLTETEYHEVELQQKKKKHRVRVTPFLNGHITNLETKMSVCPRTVLLTGIPDVMERETLQDLLEIHFQKNCNGGGEIEAFLYNPLGQHTSALFEGVPQKEQEQEQEQEQEVEEEEEVLEEEVLEEIMAAM